jgi:predicted DsbA family dithiol-disulfide isomerase
MTDRLVVDYWSDPLCIWAFVAQPRLEAVLDHHGPALDLRYRIVPVFGSVIQRFATGSWSEKGPAGKAEVTRRVARQHGREDVSGRVWVDDAPASSWASGVAVKAAQGLERDEETAAGSAAAYLLRLREAFFLEDRNIARRAVQLAVAEEVGLPAGALATRLDAGTALAALFEDFEDKEAVGIPGSPTWIFDGGRARLYGNFDETILHATVDALVRGLDVGGSAC